MVLIVLRNKVEVMHLRLDLEFVIYQELLNFCESKKDWEATFCLENFFRVGFLCLSQLGLGADDAHPVKVALLLLA